MMKKNSSAHIEFYGNPEGLGNRYEELVKLSSFAEKEDILINYYWNNSFRLKYKNLFTAKNIIFKEIDNLKKWPTKNFESTRYWREYISSQPVTRNTNVRLEIPNIDLKFEYIGIHIRGTDRILTGNNIPPGFQKLDDLERSIDLTNQYLLNNKNLLPISVFSEDPSLKQRVEKVLNNFEIISLPNIENIDPPYQDLLHLSKAKEIIMCSKFSTYALSAASIGNGKIIHFFSNRNEELRFWNLDFKYFDNSNSKNLLFSHDEFCISDLYVGNKKIKSYKVDNETIMNTKILLSFNSSDYLGFEEHFKLLNNSVKVFMYHSSLLSIKLKEFLRIFIKEKNRKIKLIKFFKESIKSFKVFNKTAIFFRNKTNNIKSPYFVFINAEELEKFYSYFESNLFKGGIVEFSNIENRDKLIDLVLNMFSKKPYSVELISQNSQIYMSIQK